MSATKYPDKFVVKSGPFGFIWDVTKVEGTETWSWQERNSIDSGPIGPYNVGIMDDCRDGMEFIFPEPEMVFPFYMTNSIGWPFKVVKGSTEGFVKVIARSVDGEDIDNCATVEHCKMMIKDGIWTVTSVGEQRPVEGSTSKSNDISTLTIKIDATEAMNALADSVERVNIALESMQKIMGEMGLSNG